MNGVLKGMLMVLAILYILSPVDLVPGPIDDILLIIMMMASNKGKNGIETI